jgi:ribosome-associated translation inhibitor RaiA
MIEAKLFIPGTMLFAKEEEDSFELAAKKTFDALRDQLVHYKERLQEKIADVKNISTEEEL